MITHRWTRRALLQAAGGGLAAQTPRVSLPHPVRVGLVGLEGHFSEVLEAAKLLPEIRIAAVSASKPRELQRITDNPVLAAARRYDDYRRMLDTEKLDVVAVCNENGQRAVAVMACAERGLAVAAEKPLALSVEDLAAVRKSVTRHGVRLTMLLPMRFDPEYLAMKGIVERGEIGEPVSLGAQKSYKLGLERGQRPDWMRRRASFGGTIPYIGIHMVDLMRWTSGREFVSTAAFQSTVGVPELGEMENNTAVVYRLDNRGTATLRMDYLRPETAPTHGDDRLRIAGTKGVVEFQGDSLTLITSSEKPRVVAGLPRRPSLFADFLDSLYNARPHLIALQDVYRVTEIVLRSREAAETGRVVECG